VIPQIRLFGKLKLRNCAPIPGLPETGFFNARARRTNPLAMAEIALFCPIERGAQLGRVTGRPESDSGCPQAITSVLYIRPVFSGKPVVDRISHGALEV
jgi:hypothetical protein